MTGKGIRVALVAAFVVALAGASLAVAAGRDKDGSTLRAHLIGYNEVPALNTTGHGDLTLTVASDKLTFELTYADLSGNPTAAHIHIGQRDVSGGVSVFFCGGGGKPPCPASPSGTVTGTIVAADVVGPVPQGFAVGDLAPVIAAIKAGVTYANMHTAKFPAGEIRGQIGHGGKGDEKKAEKKADKKG
jgi:hypothetical protein